MGKVHRCPEDLLKQDLTGKVYVVTGGNSGIGKITVDQLAKQGGTVIMTCRKPEEGEKIRAQLVKTNPKAASVEIEQLDLASLKSVRAFAERVIKKYPSIHCLVNNAGVMNTPFGKTEDGFEMQIGTNHFGHYLLTELLLPALQKETPSRIINISSCFHDKAMGREGVIDFDDMHFEKRKYDGWTAYAQSKLANVLHAKHLAIRLKEKNVLVASVHPGWVRTNLMRHSMPLWMQNYLIRPFLKLSGMIEPWEGTQTSLFAILTPELQSGAFYSQLGWYRTKAANKGGWPMESPNPHANDPEVAKRLDEVSRTLVGL
jgi:NAD(P)-dependent dehydrogenase (short-subunit alcohol dehydrogenase family)